MLKNIYAPLSGGEAQERVMEILSNNLANVQTTAFKRDLITFEAQEANPWPNYPTALPPAPFKVDMNSLYPLKGNEMSYVTLSDIKTDHTQGPLQKTDHDSHVALEGNGYFEVMTPFGTRYTRDGSFDLNANGTLVTKQGHVVQGEKGGSIIIPSSSPKLSILPTGEVYAGENLLDKIKVTSFQDESLLERLGSNLWTHNGPPDNEKSFSGRLHQGYLEGSNVNMMQDLTNLIVAHRTYEALQKSIKSQENTMQNANKIADI